MSLLIAPRGDVPAEPDSVPARVSAAEPAAVLRLLERRGVESIVLGTAKDAVSRELTAAVAGAWAGRGGLVSDIVDWPEQAASWLRQARRFVAPSPDAWVVTGRLPGWVSLGRRLVSLGGWRPDRTIVTSPMRPTDLIAAATPDMFDGLQGTTRDGRTWHIRRAIR